MFGRETDGVARPKKDPLLPAGNRKDYIDKTKDPINIGGEAYYPILEKSDRTKNKEELSGRYIPASEVDGKNGMIDWGKAKVFTSSDIVKKNGLKVDWKKFKGFTTYDDLSQMVPPSGSQREVTGEPLAALTYNTR